MSLNTGKDNTNIWKNKAILRNKIISQQKKTIQELKESRAVWKEKYKALQTDFKALNSFKKTHNFFDENLKAQRHSYPIFLVLFCVKFLSYGAQSLRGCVHTLITINMCFGLRFKKIPCHNSIRNWACKMGYYRILSAEKSDTSWVVFVDESISIGNEKQTDDITVLGIKI